ncbi:MAG: TonB-dependent receptor [Afipia sp.]|nr:TonB-dependent receptor [Afipia sp. Root123D2]MBN9597030.1 TonB-dependent receptor [Afipia sp.]
MAFAAVPQAVAQTGTQLRGAQADRSFAFNIPSKSLLAALADFTAATNIQVIRPSSEAVTGKSSPVSGNLSANAALGRILAGTGLTYRFTNARTVTIQRSQGETSNFAVSDGSVVLDPVDVSSVGATAADAPYLTPGSVSNISRQELDRIPPISTSDVFRTTPGVISAGGRSGVSINPNIRGLQGMGRVNTTVDGARQTSSSYRGYSGTRDEVFVDPDMIGGVDISKGPSDGVGTGTIGGAINFRTLEARDIVKEGNDSGIRLKASTGSNTVTPRAPVQSPASVINMASEARPGFLNGDMFSGNVAVASIKEHYEFVAAYSKRQQGNYFVGTNVPPGIVFRRGDFTWDSNNANARVPAGGEAFNTSENADSFLAKGKIKWGDGQSLELSYLYFGSIYGEISEFNIAPSGLLDNYGQVALLRTRVDTYTAKYRHNPSDNPYLNFRANLWFTDLKTDFNTALRGVRTLGGDIGNASTFATPLGELVWDNGTEIVRESAFADQYPTTITGAGGWMTLGPTGERLLSGTFSKAALKPVDWLTVSAGGRFDYYDSEGGGYLAKYPERSGSRFSPNAGIVLSPLEGLQFYGQYKEGYRPPSLRESHWHYEGLLVNNPNLRPEISKNKEVGVNLLRKDVFTTGDKLRAKLSFFDNHYDDYIFRGLRSSRGGQNVYHWINMDSANYRGFEVSGGYDAGVAFVEGAYTNYDRVEYCPTPTTCSGPSGLRTNIGAPLQTPQQADYATNYIPPTTSGSVTAGVRLFDQSMTIGGRMHFASTRFGSVWNGGRGQIGYTMSPPGYTVYDAFASYKFSDDSVFNLSIENITDEYYFGAMTALGMPSPGRTARLSYTTTLGGARLVLPDVHLGNASHGAPGSDWTGLYAGGYLGYGLGHVSGFTTALNGAVTPVAASESADIDLNNVTKGLQVGFNYQFASGLVIGMEAEHTWLKHGETQKSLAIEGGAALMAGGWMQASTQYGMDWMMALRGRAGFAFDRLLVFGTGGVAWLKETQERAQFQSNFSTLAQPGGTSTSGPEFSERTSVMRQGWTAGGGVEYALLNNWSLKGEYSYSDFGEDNFLFPRARAGVTQSYQYQEIVDYRPNPRGGPPIPVYGPMITVPGSYSTVNGRKASNRLDMHAFKIGLNYRF